MSKQDVEIRRLRSDLAEASLMISDRANQKGLTLDECIEVVKFINKSLSRK